MGGMALLHRVELEGVKMTGRVPRLVEVRRKHRRRSIGWVMMRAPCMISCLGWRVRQAIWRAEVVALTVRVHPLHYLDEL